MLSCFFLLAAQQQAPAALDRFARYVAAAQSLAVDIKLSTASVADGEGTFQFQRPNRVLFTMKWAGADYSFSSTERGIVEIERSTRHYDEFDAVDRLIAPLSRVSPAPGVGFPSVFVYQDLSQMLPDGARFKQIGKETLKGVQVDHLEAIYQTQRGIGHTNVFVDAQGRLLKMTQSLEGMEGPRVMAFEYSNYRVDHALSLESYLTKIPLGYVPYALPADARYFDENDTVGQPVLTGLDGRSSKLTYGGKGTFILFTSTHCPASQRAAKSLAAVRKHAEDQGYKVVEISAETRRQDVRGLSGAADVRFDPTGTVWTTLGLQGTPSLSLVDGQGKLVRYWYGFDPEKAKAWEQDVVDGLDGKEEEKN
ncbi:MAG: TlpA family protein disulfide reductase [Fimbriimonadaceae bacterium]|nr:TlpA family protein disulfide reductase [Chthonomonadaceae bacterium]MCO5296137.1 TlpA family protein disulfide reductase [Fimbriimonadaceae bacterium]